MAMIIIAELKKLLVAPMMIFCATILVPDRSDAAAGNIRIELNAAEDVSNHCRLSFVIEKQGDVALDTLKLDLAVFGARAPSSGDLLPKWAPYGRQ